MGFCISHPCARLTLLKCLGGQHRRVLCSKARYTMVAMDCIECEPPVAALPPCVVLRKGHVHASRTQRSTPPSQHRSDQRFAASHACFQASRCFGLNFRARIAARRAPSSPRRSLPSSRPLLPVQEMESHWLDVQSLVGIGDPRAVGIAATLV